MTDDQESSEQIPIHRRIADTLAAAIERGDYAAGSRLPSEARLVRELGVSRGTVRQALAALHRRGLTEAVPSRGTFVRGPAPVRTEHRRRVIGVVVPSVAMPYVPAVMHGIEDELHSHGYSMLAGSNGSSREQQAGRVRRIVDEGVSGLIVYPIDYEPDPGLFARLAAGGLPIVLIDRYLIGHAFDAVLADNVSGAFSVVSHLIEQGHRRIGFVSTDNITTTSVAERLKGYQQALAAAGIPDDPTLRFDRLRVMMTWGDDYRVANKDNVARIRRFLARTDTTAVFALHDHLALEVLEAARSLGRRVPEDLAVAGFDDDPLAGALSVPLTTVAQPRDRIGRVAARIALDRIAGERIELARIVLPTRLVIRASSVAQVPLESVPA
jgi:GntR family transcriptional regulator, arabinose operon transcriptional repressor